MDFTKFLGKNLVKRFGIVMKWQNKDPVFLERKPDYLYFSLLLSRKMITFKGKGRAGRA